MPHLHIQMYPGRDSETKTKLAEQMEKCMMEVLGSSSDSISISLEEIEPANWHDEVVQKTLIDKKEQVMKLPGYDLTK